MMLQIATVYAGALYDVDPLDQPGVELGKELTYGSWDVAALKHRRRRNAPIESWADGDRVSER